MVGKFDLMDQNINTRNLGPYAKHQNTEEWVILSHLLDELINIQELGNWLVLFRLFYRHFCEFLKRSILI